MPVDNVTKLAMLSCPILGPVLVGECCLLSFHSLLVGMPHQVWLSVVFGQGGDEESKAKAAFSGSPSGRPFFTALFYLNCSLCIFCFELVIA